jgi:DNA-binding transcriptional LysR family regulator
VAQGEAGTLRIAFLPFLLDEEIAQVVRDLQVVRPQVTVTLHELPFHQRYRALREGETDVAVIDLPMSEPDLEHGKVLLRSERVLAVPVGHRLADRGRLTMEDLAGERMFCTGEGAPDYWVEFWSPRATPSGQAILRGPQVTTVQEVVSAVAAGLGVELMPRLTLERYQPAGLRAVPIDTAPFEMAAVWRRDPSPLVRTFVTLLEERLAV